MFARKLWMTVLFVIISGSGLCAPARAQESSAAKPATAVEAEAAPRDYRLDFIVSELEEGKRINARQYSMHVASASQPGRSSSNGYVEVGNRMPVTTDEKGSVQYIDVGTKITASVSVRDGVLVANARCDLSSVTSDQQSGGGRPILRTFVINNEMPVTEGKTAVLGTADDPNSKRQFQVEVTVTEPK